MVAILQHNWLIGTLICSGCLVFFTLTSLKENSLEICSPLSKHSTFLNKGKLFVLLVTCALCKVRAFVAQWMGPSWNFQKFYDRFYRKKTITVGKTNELLACGADV